MSVQVGIVAVSYAAAFGIMCALHATGVKMVQDIAWGFNFIFGVITATLIKALLVFLRKKNVKLRQLRNLMRKKPLMKRLVDPKKFRT